MTFTLRTAEQEYSYKSIVELRNKLVLVDVFIPPLPYFRFWCHQTHISRTSSISSTISSLLRHRRLLFCNVSFPWVIRIIHLLRLPPLSVD